MKSDGEAVLDMCLPVELRVKKEAQPSYWFGLNDEPSLNYLVGRMDSPFRPPFFGVAPSGSAGAKMSAR
jgi:hypothetical protein